MNIREADKLITEQKPKLIKKRYYLIGGDTQRTFVVAALTIKEIGAGDFQVFALLHLERPEIEAWDVNIKSLDLFFTEL